MYDCNIQRLVNRQFKVRGKNPLDPVFLTSPSQYSSAPASTKEFLTLSKVNHSWISPSRVDLFFLLALIMANSSLNSLADYSSSDDEEVLQPPKTRCARQRFSRSPQPNQSNDDWLASSELEDEQSQPQPSTSEHHLAAQSHEITDEESEEDSVTTPAKRKKNTTAYALQMDQLPGPLQKFLEAVKKFFMQTVNLQRQRAPVSITTYAKGHERMLCK